MLLVWMAFAATVFFLGIRLAQTLKTPFGYKNYGVFHRLCGKAYFPFEK
jgi:hypothetical protein